jgi:hypothetical protein
MPFACFIEEIEAGNIISHRESFYPEWPFLLNGKNSMLK